jgi:hypothetical protein
MCAVYIHDTLQNSPDRLFTRPQIRTHARILVPGFLRVVWMGEHLHDLAIQVVELGLVKKPRSFPLWTPLPIAHDWINEQRQRIGNLREVHENHSRTIREDDLYV